MLICLFIQFFIRNMKDPITNNFFKSLWKNPKDAFSGFLFGVLISGAVVGYLVSLQHEPLKLQISSLEKAIDTITTHHEKSLSDRNEIYNQKTLLLNYELSKLSNENIELITTNKDLTLRVSELSNVLKIEQDTNLAQQNLLERTEQLRKHIANLDIHLKEANILAAKHKQACEEYQQGRNFHWVSKADCENYNLAKLDIASVIKSIEESNSELKIITQKLVAE